MANLGSPKGTSGGEVLAWPRGGLLKRVLYHSPTKDHLTEIFRLLSDVPGCTPDATSTPPAVSYRDLQISFVACNETGEVMRLLHAGYFNLVIIDLRNLAGDERTFEAQESQALGLLDAMDDVDIEERYGFHRILVLVSGTDGDRVDRLIAELGRRQVGRVVRDPTCAGEGGRAAARTSFGRLVLDEISRMMLERRVGKTSLCLTGGGTTGIYFELGALKCLDDCLGAGSMNRFDMFFGISAGAVVSGVLSNGYSVDEFMAALAGHEVGRVKRLSLSLLRLGHVNFGDMRSRLARAGRKVAREMWNVARGRSRLSLSSVFPDYSDWIGPPFQGDRFEEILRTMFTLEGATNDFRRLTRPLYVGATDHDTRSPVLFGDNGWDGVPISKAIQASLSMNPAFQSTFIGGRYYTDGAVTRTSNFGTAIKKGADLILLVDPFLPYVSREPGFARDRGFLYHIDQDVRTMSYTRFENARNAALRRHPDVSFYAFLPANSLRRLLSVNPMDHRPFLPIWRGAYLSTLRRITMIRHRLRGDFAVHGLALDTSRAEEVARRLQSVEQPTFADFFPDGKIDIHQPLLSLEQVAAEDKAAARVRAAGPTAAA